MRHRPESLEQKDKKKIHFGIRCVAVVLPSCEAGRNRYSGGRMTVESNELPPIEGQLSAGEREFLTNSIVTAARRPKIVLEVGTWLGGGSTLHILRALERNGEGHLWGIEGYRQVYDKMLANLKIGAPAALHRFTPLFGFSQDVIPKWLAQQGANLEIDLAFLDGGNNPLEQIIEFRLLQEHIPVGGQLMAHDARFRKGKWLVPYLECLDNWKTTIHDLSEVGLLHAAKIAPRPTPASLKAANRRLWKGRLQPVELAAALLPSPVCAFVSKRLPRNLSLKLTDGGKPKDSQ
jgi:predicted O-methyltransferase YrrM